MFELKAELILDAKTMLGEGSLWSPEKQALYWVDILGRKVMLFDPVSRENRVYETPSDVGTVVQANSGDLLLALTDGFYRLNPQSGQVSMVAEQKGLGLRFNDGKCDPAGRFWAGTMAHDCTPNAGALYCMDADYSVRRMVNGVTISNGIVWNKAKDTMYYVDSPTFRVDAFDYELATGNISNRRTAVSVPDEIGLPDGMTIDDQDNLWVAHYGAGHVTSWDPVAGTLLGRVEIPGGNLVTSCAFGGEQMKELFITTASCREDAGPRGGGLFWVQLETSGPAPNKFAD